MSGSGRCPASAIESEQRALFGPQDGEISAPPQLRGRKFGGLEALEDRKPRPGKIWNKVPDDIATAVVDLALEEPELSPRELAVTFTETRR